MKLYHDYLAEGYKHGAPTLEVEEMDAGIAEQAICPICGGQCGYDAWHKDGSYIALVVCSVCGWEQEF